VSCGVAKSSDGPGGNQAVFWVGLGGYVKGDPLIQAGVAETANKRTGRAEYWAWWEVEPAESDKRFPGTFQRRFQRVRVSPGDRIEVDLGLSVSGATSTAFMDVGGGQGTAIKEFTIPERVSVHSAEVIAERPTCPRVCNLTAFSPVSFQGELFMRGAGVPDNGRVPMDAGLGTSLHKLTLTARHRVLGVSVRKTLADITNAAGQVTVVWRRAS
jgi:hypothetical protein